jgi:methyltransferase
MILNLVILAFVTLERLGELWLSNRNTRRLVAQGAQEAGAGHYPVMIAIHVLWLAALWWLAPWRQVDGFWLAAFVLLELARIWVVATLGQRWTTRIIVLPQAPLVRAGPYRWVDHPNYMVVVGEIAVLPLVFGLWQVALLFSLLTAAILAVRIREENRALRPQGSLARPLP